MNRRKFVHVLGGLTATTALAGCSTLDSASTDGNGSDDAVTATVDGKELWMSHRREGREPGSTAVIYFDPDVAWIDERFERRIDANNEDIELGDSLADLPIPEIGAELDGISTWVVFILDLHTPDEINGIEEIDGNGYYRYGAPTAFFDRVPVGSEHTFRVTTPDDYYVGAGDGLLIDIVE
ncbi:hypothetical protein ACLI4R_09230 [Natrialbaceae archaeon A-chndr2]